MSAECFQNKLFKTLFQEPYRSVKVNSLCSSMVKGRGGRFLTEKPAALPIIYTTLTNLHNSNPDVGQARFSSVPRRWINPDLTLHVTVQMCALDQS